MVTIEKIDFSQWGVSEFIEDILLLSPADNGKVDVEFVKFPQPHELLLLNVAPAALESGSRGSILCGKSDRNSVYHATLEQPICIVQFKPHAWYAFSRNRVQSFRNRMVPLQCNFGSCLKSFIQKHLPGYLLRVLKREKMKESAYRMMPAMFDYVEAHLNTVTVSSLAAAFRISEATLRRYFNKYVGMNVNGYIRHRKLRKMIYRMYDNDYNAVAVQECGFYDQSHFIREFKRIHKVTPTHYLQNFRNLCHTKEHADRLFGACYFRTVRPHV